jgi:hypothetical protein
VKSAFFEGDLFTLGKKHYSLARELIYNVSRPQIYYSHGFLLVLELRKKRVEISLRYNQELVHNLASWRGFPLHGTRNSYCHSSLVAIFPLED